MASTMSTSGTGGLDVLRERGHWARFGLGDRSVDLGQCALGRFLFSVLVPQTAALEVRAQPRQRVARAPLGDLLGRLVAARIVCGGMRADAIRECLDQRWSFAGSRALDSPLAHGVDGERVVAVDDRTR